MRHWMPRSALGFSLATLLWASCADLTSAGDRIKLTGYWANRTTSVEQLAKSIDKLERHIDEYGTIVAKRPDVWGESRLMQHRAEYERVMSADLGRFEPSLQASIRRTDEAFLATAVSLQAAISGKRAIFRPNSPPQPTVTNSTETVQTHEVTVKNLFKDPKNTELGITENTETTTSEETKPPKDEFISIPAGATLSNTGLQDYSAKSSLSNSAPAGFNNTTISLEPTVLLDQKSRYVQHLNELRRINEGDDIAASPGYDLDLVRIPVSVLTGKKTREGFGAEITITVNPDLGDELLPTTFHGWVMNDLLTQIAVPMTRALNDQGMKELTRECDSLVAVLDGYQSPHEYKFSIQPETINQLNISSWTDANWNDYRQNRQQVGDPVDWYLRDWFTNPDDFFKNLVASRAPQISKNLEKLNIPSNFPQIQAYISGDKSVSQDAIVDFFSDSNINLAPVAQNQSLTWLLFAHYFNQYRSAIKSSSILTTIDAGDSRSRSTVLPFPLSQFSEVYGQGILLRVVWEAWSRIGVGNDYVHYHDVENYLKEELQASWEMLDNHPELWGNFCTPDLARAIRTRNRTAIIAQQQAFYINIKNSDPVVEGSRQNGPQNTTTAAYAWAIICESALLNERLLQDIKETVANRACPCAYTDGWMAFYGPEPAPEARAIFKEYVHCRWPVHVFAIDPITQDQNIADSFGMRREMQLAISLAFASGRINAQQMTKFVRKLEMEIQTIDLNRTAIGFSHGDNTVGWRFQPRVQTPPTRGNLHVAVNDLLIGGPRRDQLIRTLRLESGMRECVALVARPSFIQQLSFDVRSNWYALTNPKRTEQSLQQTVALSRDIKSMEQLACICTGEEHLYRQGEVHRLLSRVDQLSKELPLQTLRTEVPREASEGGFAVFNAGSVSLAPQLYSWYGAPGIAEGESTSLFLIGEHFGVQGTRVIVGNKPIFPKPVTKLDSPQDILTSVGKNFRGISQPGTEFFPTTESLAQNVNVELLSHKVMRVEIPPGVRPTKKNYLGDDPVVEIHIATPYGVSQPLYVKYLPKEKPETSDSVPSKIELKSTFAWKETPDFSTEIRFFKDATGKKPEICFIGNTSSNAQDPLIIEAKGEIFPSLFLIKNAGQGNPVEIPAQLTLSYSYKRKDGKVFRQELQTDKFLDITFAPNGRAKLPEEKFLSFVSQQLAIDLTRAQAATEVSVSGLVRFKEDDLPIYKLQNSISIAIKEADCPCPEDGCPQPGIQHPPAPEKHSSQNTPLFKKRNAEITFRKPQQEEEPTETATEEVFEQPTQPLPEPYVDEQPVSEEQSENPEEEGTSEITSDNQPGRASVNE